MKYRFEETLTWIIPGFYFLLYSFILVCLLYSSSIEIPNEGNAIGVYISILIFTIPMLSLIIGWLVDGYGGYLFRKIIKGPIQKGYKLVFHRDVSVEDAEKAFDEARDRINLNTVDRFYYRYIFSRNMYTAQIGLLLVTIILLLLSKEACNCCKLWYLVVWGIILLAYYPIVHRDLTTHVKYVLLEDLNATNRPNNGGQNNTPQSPTNP